MHVFGLWNEVAEFTELKLHIRRFPGTEKPVSPMFEKNKTKQPKTQFSIRVSETVGIE